MLIVLSCCCRLLLRPPSAALPCAFRPYEQPPESSCIERGLMTRRQWPRCAWCRHSRLLKVQSRARQSGWHCPRPGANNRPARGSTAHGRHGGRRRRAGAHSSLRLPMDLHAYSWPLALCTARRVVPNCPRPSTRPRVYTVHTSCARIIQKLGGIVQMWGEGCGPAAPPAPEHAGQRIHAARVRRAHIPNCIQMWTSRTARGRARGPTRTQRACPARLHPPRVRHLQGGPALAGLCAARRARAAQLLRASSCAHACD